MAEARGWAVRQGDELLVETVSPSRRGAIVNWLVVHVPLGVSNSATDEAIETGWMLFSRQRGAQVVEVYVRDTLGH